MSNNSSTNVGFTGPTGVAKETIEQLAKDIDELKRLTDRIVCNANIIMQAHAWDEEYSKVFNLNIGKESVDGLN